MAARNPAMPLPMTRKSVVIVSDSRCMRRLPGKRRFQRFLADSHAVMFLIVQTVHVKKLTVPLLEFSTEFSYSNKSNGARTQRAPSFVDSFSLRETPYSG